MNMQERAKARGLRLIESTKPLILVVNAKDIKLASTKQADECAFARACKRRNTQVERAYFFRSTAYIQTKKTLTKYKIPTSMQKEIVAFDRGGKFAPGNYKLSPSFQEKKGCGVKPSGKKPGKNKKPGKRQNRTKDIRPTFNVLA